MTASGTWVLTGQRQSGCCAAGPWCATTASRGGRRTTTISRQALWTSTRFRRLTPPTPVSWASDLITWVSPPPFVMGNAGGLQWPLVALDSLLYSYGCPSRPFQSNPACIFLCMIFIFKLNRGYKYPPFLSLQTKLWFINLIFKVLFVKLSLSNFCHWVTLTNIEIIISTQPLLVWAFHSSVHGHLTVEWLCLSAQSM